MVKKLPTKAELRAQLELQTRRYLDGGGKVQHVAKGETGNDPLKPSTFSAGGLFTQPRATRTLVPEVVAAIERRRLQARLKRRPVRKRSRLPTPRRKTVYDDFGEPIRKIWVDE